MKTIRLNEEGVTELQICHPNGETRWLVIEAWHERWICVRWPMAGQYDIILKDGRMVARSTSARIKHPQNPWRAASKLDCREWVGEKLGITKEEIETRFAAHHNNMPSTKAEQAKLEVRVRSLVSARRCSARIRKL